MSQKTPPSEHDVAIAAFHLWEAEGRPDGMAEAHWHRAREMLEAQEAFEPQAAGNRTAAKSGTKPAADAAPATKKSRSRKSAAG